MTTSTPTATHLPTGPTERPIARTVERICASGGVAFAILFGVGFVAIAGFVPPLSPADSAGETLQLFQENVTSIRIGLLLCYVGTTGFLLFGSGILGQTRRIKGVPPAITYLQVSSYASAVLLIILPLMFWLTIAYRPEAWSPESAQLMNDLGWISFVIGFAPFVTWVMSTGLAILCDTSATPLYPRWSGYLSLFMGFIQVSAALLVFFKSGPFAWNGLFAWWIPMTDFFTWFLVITWLTMKAINRRDAYVAGQ